MAQNQENQHWKVLVLMLKNIARAKSLSVEDIALKSGLKTSNVKRIFSLYYTPTLSNFISIARAVEVNFFFEDKEDKTDLSLIFEQAMTELGRRPDKLNNKN